MRYIKLYENFKKPITFEDWCVQNNVNTNREKITIDTGNIVDLDGIEEFTKLKNLIFVNNTINKKPDFSKNLDLELLVLDRNKAWLLPDLTHLKKLKIFSCSNNNLSKLPELPKSLNILDCSGNKISKLPDLSIFYELKQLIINNNFIDINNFPKLYYLPVFNRLGAYDNILLPFNTNKEYRKWYEDNNIEEVYNYNKSKKYNI